MHPATPPVRSPARATSNAATGRSSVLAAAADALLILVFAAIGRDAHHRGDIVTGVLSTAWPFLAGAALSWIALRLWRRSPLALWPAGVAVWLGAVVVGMLLRAVTGQIVVVPFVIVAFLSLGLLLLGYRLGTAAVFRFRSRRRKE